MASVHELEPIEIRSAHPSVCHVTRFRVASRLDVLRIFLAFLRIRRAARVAVPGFVDALFLRSGTAVVIVSLWSHDSAIADFATAVPEHAHRVRWVKRRAVLWSGLFELLGTSSSAGVWDASEAKGVVS